VRKDWSLLKKVCEQQIPFNRHLGITVERMEPGVAELRLPFKEEFIGDTSRPAIHGGVISTLVDTAGAVAAYTQLTPEDRLSTVDLLVDYLAPATRAELRAEAHVVRMGNRVVLAHVTVRQNHSEEIVAHGRVVYNIARSSKKE
jgi:uncharacterized protein (TIGR00369 family)